MINKSKIRKHLSSRQNIIGYSILLLLILYAIYLSIEKSYLLKNYGKCTVGITRGIHIGNSGQSNVIYEYKVDNELLSETRFKMGDIVTNNGKYLVVYYQYSSGWIIR